MTKQNAFTQFVNDENGYLRWLAQTPDGFVVNSNRVPVSSYLILHRASCKWINTSARTNWTTTGYIKTCSNDLISLTEWAEREVGGSLKPCKSCQPDPRSRTTPTQRLDPISETEIEVLESWAPSSSATSLPPGKRSVPPTISTGCPELDLAWKTYASMILNRSQILIPDTDDDLTWHAFLGHSIDMQGFRAAEFAGVDPLTRNAPKFVPLKIRGIGVPELASLWKITSIREHLQSGRWDDFLRPETLSVLRADGGTIGQSLADALEHFPWRKFRWSVRALLQNSDALRPFDFSFRRWLQRECDRLGVKDFPPTDFRQAVTVSGKKATVEQALRERLDAAFYMVGPAMSAYMLCDWQLWLWREGLTAGFANFKLDSFHQAFVKKFGKGVIPAGEEGFAHWWHDLLPDLPPRLANECTWLAVENKLVDPWTEPMTEPMATEGGTPGSTRITYPYESGFIQAPKGGSQAREEDTARW